MEQRASEQCRGQPKKVHNYLGAVLFMQKLRLPGKLSLLDRTMT